MRVTRTKPRWVVPARTRFEKGCRHTTCVTSLRCVHTLCCCTARSLNESQRAVAQVRVRVLHRDFVLCVSQATLRVFVVVLWLGHCGGHTRKVSSLPRLTTSRSGAPGRTVGEVEDLRKVACCATRVCCDSRFTVRARAARAE